MNRCSTTHGKLLNCKENYNHKGGGAAFDTEECNEMILHFQLH